MSSGSGLDASARRPGKKTARLLVVEDDARLAGYVVEGLRQQGFGVDFASEAKAAEAALVGTRYDGIVLGLALSNGDAPGLLERLRQRNDRTPVLVIRPRGEHDGRAEDGADGHVVRPFAISELTTRLQALVRRPDDGRDGRAKKNAADEA